jgi:hypothetical protein
MLGEFLKAGSHNRSRLRAAHPAGPPPLIIPALSGLRGADSQPVKSHETGNGSGQKRANITPKPMRRGFIDPNCFNRNEFLVGGRGWRARLSWQNRVGTRDPRVFRRSGEMGRR